MVLSEWIYIPQHIPYPVSCRMPGATHFPSETSIKMSADLWIICLSIRGSPQSIEEGSLALNLQWWHVWPHIGITIHTMWMCNTYTKVLNCTLWIDTYLLIYVDTYLFKKIQCHSQISEDLYISLLEYPHSRSLFRSIWINLGLIQINLSHFISLFRSI